MTHDYKRNGTTDLFAAMNVATGEVLYDTQEAHTATDVLAFFKLIDLHVPTDLDIHVVLDNLSAHKAPPVADWLAHPKRARWHLHFTPTSSSWLNLVERWFAELTEQATPKRRCHSPRCRHLIEAIELWAEHWNDDPKPFVWHKPAEEIIAKVRRGRAALPTSQIRDGPLAPAPACSCMGDRRWGDNHVGPREVCSPAARSHRCDRGWPAQVGLRWRPAGCPGVRRCGGR